MPVLLSCLRVRDNVCLRGPERKGRGWFFFCRWRRNKMKRGRGVRLVWRRTTEKRQNARGRESETTERTGCGLRGAAETERPTR